MSFLLTETEYYHRDIFNKEDLRYAIKETINDHLLISNAVHCCAFCNAQQVDNNPLLRKAIIEYQSLRFADAIKELKKS
jgi:hypothetical protein